MPRGVATEKGLGYLCEYSGRRREIIGWETPLAADHFGPLNVNDAIRYCKAFEPYNLAWAEDLIPECWLNWRGFKTIKEATTTPVLTGEQAFGLEEGFRDLIDNYAVDIIHPDYVASGGLREIKRIADYAAAHGIATVIHQPGSPIGQVAMAHLAATLTNFVACEHHAADMPWWQDLVRTPAKPIIKDGYVDCPRRSGPGRGTQRRGREGTSALSRLFRADADVRRLSLPVGCRRAGPWPHFDEEGNWCNCVTY